MARPLKYKTPEELEKAVKAYFRKCDRGRQVKYLNKKGDVITAKLPIPSTVEGLSVHLDITRKTLLNYEGRPEFLHIITSAKEKIASRLMEDSLMNLTNPVMAKLNLAANFGYADKAEVKVKTKKVKFNF